MRVHYISKLRMGCPCFASVVQHVPHFQPVKATLEAPGRRGPLGILKQILASISLVIFPRDFQFLKCNIYNIPYDGFLRRVKCSIASFNQA